MSYEDPTLLPPNWQEQFDGDQHKIQTESGLLDFMENYVEEVEHWFRSKEDWSELPESAKVLRKVLQKEIEAKRGVKIINISQVDRATVKTMDAVTTPELVMEKNENRRGLLVQNLTNGNMFLSYGQLTSASGYNISVLLQQLGYWEMPHPIYTGQMTAYWAGAASPGATFTELVD